MVNSCCAVGCTNRFVKGAGISFHTFPSDEKRKALWIIAVKRKNWYPSPFSVLCGKHFQTGKPNPDEGHPDYVPSIFPVSKGLIRSAAKYEMRKKCLNRIMLAKEANDITRTNDDQENVSAANILQLDVKKESKEKQRVGVNSLKRRILKKNAVPSCNLPISPENNDEIQSNLGLKQRIKSISKNKFSVSKKMKSKIRESKCLDVKSSHEFKNHQEETKSELTSTSTDETNEKNIVTSSPIITKLSVMAPSYSSVDVAEQNCEDLDKCSQNATVPMILVKHQENSEFDCSKYNSSPDDSREILTQKLETVLSVNARLQKRVKFYQNRCQMYEKEVKIMKGVIDSLKQINSVTHDN